MPTLKVTPHSGLNRRFPEHKISGDKAQYCLELENLLSLDGKITRIEGAQALNSNTQQGDAKWAKRLYFRLGPDEYKYQFCAMEGKIFKLRENLGTLEQVPIDNDYSATIDKDFYPFDAQFEVSEQITTILVDGTYFYKFNGNTAGNWERLALKQDIDGNTIEPIHITNYLDRSIVISKQRNALLVSKNLNPEVYDESTDCAIIALPPGRGGYPVATIVFRGRLFVIHEDYFAPVSGSSIYDFGIFPNDIIYGYGSRAPRSILNLKSHFGFLNTTDNEYYLSQGNLDSTDRTPLSYQIKLGELINPVKSHLTVAHLDTRYNMIRIAYYLSGGTELGSEELYSLDEKKWCGQTRGRKVSCYSQWDAKGEDRRLITGRSDEGTLMWNTPTVLNYDGSGIHYKFVSASYVADNEWCDVEFERFYLDMKSLGNFSVPFYYYLDSRITTRGNENVNMQGEIINLGLIEIGEQSSFVNSVVPFIDRSKGRMIRFQIEETASDRVFEFYGIYAEYNKHATKQSKYMVGQ